VLPGGDSQNARFRALVMQQGVIEGRSHDGRHRLLWHRNIGGRF
jgi:hypothetical protein